MAEHAAAQLYKALLIKGRVISVNWAKPMKQAVIDGEDNGKYLSFSTYCIRHFF